MSNDNPHRIAAIELPLTPAEVDQQALQNLSRMNGHSRVGALRADFLRTLQMPIALKGRMNRALKVADQFAAEVVPYSACRHGCSYCCHTPIAISTLEAQLIGDFIGKAPRKATARQSREEIEHYHRQPCPFLVGGKCSIYSARPMACRLMFNMADSPYFCNTDIEPEDSHVTQLNLKDVEFAFTGTFMGAGFADIRDFFPKPSTQNINR
jgi:Fe-S-cluster containining protein